MLRKILFVLTVFMIGFMGYVAMQPAEFRITRTVLITAPSAIIFPHVNNQHAWAAWSPWDKLDPQAEKHFEGPDEGKGSIVRWSGNDQMGAGSSTIIESTPNSVIKMRLEFLRPMEAISMSEFNFEEIGNQTRVTWSMYGTNNFIGKAVSVIMNCDEMVGSEFEKGLNALKAIAEKQASTQG